MITIDLSKSSGFIHHRSGWQFCLSQLKTLHSRSGIFCDDFIERSFSWYLHDHFRGKSIHKIPYKHKWIGFLHNPPNMPNWFNYFDSPNAILSRPIFQESLKTCKLLIVLSKYLKEWLSSRVDVPIIDLKHPTQIPKLKWCPDKFIHQRCKPVIQLGYWLRKLDSLHKLKIGTDYTKIWLPSSYDYTLTMLDVYNKTNPDAHQSRYMWAGVSMLKFLEADEFDELLTRGVVFLDLYDSSANNAIIESMSRNTPIIVNKLPAVVEYLGADYPLYFDNLSEAESKIRNIDLIIEAHKYLKNMPKYFLSGRYFVNDFKKKLENIL
jgi:hypothetical protein